MSLTFRESPLDWLMCQSTRVQCSTSSQSVSLVVILILNWAAARQWAAGKRRDGHRDDVVPLLTSNLSFLKKDYLLATENNGRLVFRY